MATVIPAVWTSQKIEVGCRDDHNPAVHARRANSIQLETALRTGREQLLALFDGFEKALGVRGLQIAFDPLLNLPLWELGHIGWFEELWLSRNRDRGRGNRCGPQVDRAPSLLARADALYDSSSVPHARRWSLDLPPPDDTRTYLSGVRDTTLALLRDSAQGDDDLYFFRLVLFHEDMHREAWHVMAQHLGIGLDPGLAVAARPAQVHKGEPPDWRVPGGLRSLGTEPPGFAFDNELGACRVDVEAFSIDRQPVTWRRFLPFIEAGGYEVEPLWTCEGWEWRKRQGCSHPAHLQRSALHGWQQRQFGVWRPLDPDAFAVHLTAHEAQAWCQWAGRRLPTEIEWETAALLAVELDETFEWGDVWEWTSSPFVPYAGFTAHPYRDYSLPWFDGRPVLRGGSFATVPRMKHPCYRNFFTADRSDVFSGFRSCAQVWALHPPEMTVRHI